MDPKEGIECKGYARHDAKGDLVPFKFLRRHPGPDDVVFRVTHCGICYADLIWTYNWIGDVQYPVVPGHEIVGVVTEVGSNVTKFKVGDRVGAGYVAESCENCEACDEKMESMCDSKAGAIRVFNAILKDGTITRGGFSDIMVSNQRYTVKIPDGLKSDVAAPLLCAGITVYSPMMRHGLGEQPGKKVGVIGLGGVGHMAVKIAKALGHHVTVFSTSISKKEEAMGVLGADDFVVTTDEAAMKAEAESFDFIINTASANIPLDPYLSLLKQKGVFVIVGAGSELKFSPHLIFKRKVITGSAAGGMEEMQEMLNFCAEKGVGAMVEVVSLEKVNEAFERLLKNDVRYRFVVDLENAF